MLGLARKATPLAWRNMVSNPMKLLLSAGGVGFAVLLMFSQIGFRNGLFDSTVQVAKILDADLIIVSKAKYNLPSEQRFDARLLPRVAQVEGVHSAAPIFIERAGTELRVLGSPSRSIRVIGVPTDKVVFADRNIARVQHLLQQERTALLDRRTKDVYGLDTRRLNDLQKQQVELTGNRIDFVGYVEIGTDFVNDGTIVVSEQSFADYFPLRRGMGASLQKIAGCDLGLVKLQPKTSVEKLRVEINALAPQEVDVFTKAEVIARDIKFWGTATPIGIIFTVGTLMGLAVGTIICYQILFTDINENLSEFATLKAMGYPKRFFTRLVFMQSIYLTLFGFVPAWAVSSIVYRLLTNSTGLIMELTVGRLLSILALTFIMCLIGGFLALRKLHATDPADLFT